MPNFAIYKDNIVFNVIVADSKEIAEEVTGANAIETTGNPWIDWTFVDGVWTAPEIKEEVVDE